MYTYSMTQWLAFFFIYCFFGWCFESVYVSVHEHRWVNRGFMTGPYIPLYGSGAVLMLFLTIPVRGNYLLMYIVGAIGATVLEYITGTVMENLFGVRYWDYTDKKFNFRGRICLEATVLWGFFTLAMVEVIQPPIEHMVMMINDRVLYYMTWGITVVFTFDFASSFRTAIDLKEVLIQAERAKEEVQRMQKRVEVLEAVVNDSLESAKDGMEVRWDEQKQRMALLTEERMTELARHMDALRKRLENSESIERIREAVETSGAGEKLEDIQNEMRQMLSRPKQIWLFCLRCLSVHTTRKPFRQLPSRKAGKHGRRCQRRQQRIMFILWREVYRRVRMGIFTVQPILLTEKADRLASTARCICLILMWKVDSITVSPASLRLGMKCVLSKQNLVRLV